MAKSSKAKEWLAYTGLAVGVTIVGLVAGAGLTMPTITREQRLYAVGAVAVLAGVVLIVDVARREIPRLFNRLRSRRTQLASRMASRGVSAARATGPTPSIKLGGRASRTPRAVQALAAAGAAPTEIAWKTGLPVDAVSMLLEIGGAR